MNKRPNFSHILSLLVESKVEFILVGGVSAVLQGAPVTTFDLDIVHRRTEDNAERLTAFLNQIGAEYRGQFGRKLEPQSDALLGAGHHLFNSNLGPVDVLGTIGEGLSYEDLLPHSREFRIGSGMTILILDLEMLITIKEKLGFEKDLAMLPILRRTLEERRNGDSTND